MHVPLLFEQSIQLSVSSLVTARSSEKETGGGRTSLNDISRKYTSVVIKGDNQSNNFIASSAQTLGGAILTIEILFRGTATLPVQLR